MQDLVSVVIPIYKTEAYLDQCIESVTNQTYRNLEIILVDDGSPDKCGKICDDWAKKDSRIRVIHKNNEGLGMARNTGIDNATGQFICFFDSDDYVDLTAIEKSLREISRTSADVVLFGFTDVDNNAKYLKSLVPTPKQVTYCGHEVQHLFLPELLGSNLETGKNANLWISACLCLFSMKLIRDSAWRFVSEREIISEDVYSLLELYAFVKKVTIVSESLYFIRQNSTSLSRSYRPDRFTKSRYFYGRCIQLCRDKKYTEEVKRKCGAIFLSHTITAMKQEMATDFSFGKKKTSIKQIIDNELLQQVLLERNNDKQNLKKRILFWLMRKKQYNLCCLLLALQNLR